MPSCLLSITPSPAGWDGAGDTIILPDVAGWDGAGDTIILPDVAGDGADDTIILAGVAGDRSGDTIILPDVAGWDGAGDTIILPDVAGDSAGDPIILPDVAGDDAGDTIILPGGAWNDAGKTIILPGGAGDGAGDTIIVRNVVERLSCDVCPFHSGIGAAVLHSDVIFIRLLGMYIARGRDAMAVYGGAGDAILRGENGGDPSGGASHSESKPTSKYDNDVLLVGFVWNNG
jgi:hypothetical protein